MEFSPRQTVVVGAAQVSKPKFQFHGGGSDALFEQARLLERDPESVHVLVAFGPGGDRREIVVEGRAECLRMAELLREKAEEWREIEDAQQHN